MRRHRRWLVVGAVGVGTSLGTTIGCGKTAPATSDATPIDAALSGPCWIDTYTPNGTLTLGTGISQFTPMPDQVALEFGSQFGFDIPVNVQTTGLLPGDPNDPLGPHNPRTRFHASFTVGGDETVLTNCVRLGYNSDGTMVHGVGILFDTALTGSDLFGLQVQITAETIDGNGNYAMDQKMVTCAPPPGWPGCCPGGS